MTRATYRVDLSSSVTGRGEALRGGLCVDLPLQVVDRYWRAHARHDRFAYLTALQVCHQCPVREACLTQAVQEARSTHPFAVRGGASFADQTHLRHLWLSERRPLARVIREYLSSSLPPFRGAYGHADMRLGRMDTHERTAS